ncbi:hypothetical protein LOK74_19640 [Brevibacillus humidisoli]|uniref:hypothetical protein n=1 Tax=Brevibacillus humidisoli TaxID=2895522 RepID=UPI001E384106|nr:hypothetical protein [Brevibacillus humidisoli]UFJ40223.1 hypothetical protein LOK74_19640 [Brevibacillus humidisoli]
MIVAAANGNPDWVWREGKSQTEPDPDNPGRRVPIIKSFSVAQRYEWVDFGSLVRLSGGGSPNERRTGDGVSDPLFTTEWDTTPKPLINSIKFNGVEVARNNQGDNHSPLITNYIHKADAGPIQVNITQTVYGINPTRNILEVYFDGFKDDSLGIVTNDSAAGSYQINHSFTISNPASLQPGMSHEVKFRVLDDFHREAYVTVRYTVEGECDPTASGTWGTIKPAGESSSTVPSMGTFELPEGSDEVTLTFDKPGRLKVDGVDFGGVSQTFRVPITGPTTVYYLSEDGTDCWQKSIVPTVPDDECDPELSTFQMPVDPFPHNRRVLESGGFYALERDTDTLQFWPGVKGTYYKNGSIVAENKETFSIPVSASEGSFTIKFVSEEGQCWEHRFGWQSAEDTYSCPKVEYSLNRNDDKTERVGDGDTIYIRPGTYLRLDAYYLDEEGDRTGARVFWHMKTPSGKIRHYDDNLTSVFTYDRFDEEMGTYEIWISFDPNSKSGESWIEQGCSWKMFVVVEDSYQCEQVTVEGFVGSRSVSMSGSGTQSSPYRLQIPFGANPEQDYGVRLSYNGESWNIPEEWTIYDKNGTDITREYSWSGGENRLYSAIKYLDTDTLPHLIVVKVNYTNQSDCIRYIEISMGEFSCDDVWVKAEVDGDRVSMTGTGTQSNPYELDLRLGGRYDVDFTAFYDSSYKGVTADWELTKDGSTYSRIVNDDNPFSHTFSDSSDASYTLRVTVHVGSETCIVYIKVNVKPVDCSDAYISAFYDGIALDEGDGDGSLSAPYEINILKSGKETLFRARFNMQDADANWTLKRGSFTGTTIETESGQVEFSYRFTDTSVTTYYLIVEIDTGTEPCTKYMIIHLTDKVCTGYLHVGVVLEGETQWILNQDGKTVTVEAEHVDTIAAFVGYWPNQWEGAFYKADWTGTRSNESPAEGLYAMFDVEPGTYHIKGVVNEDSFDQLNVGCEYSVTVVVTGNETPDPGGDLDGGEVEIRIYDSRNRMLRDAADGVWEREPARIEVTIDQNKIREAFSQIDDQINQKATEQKNEWESRYSGPEYENVMVTISPPVWNSETSPTTEWPSTLRLSLEGPGTDQTFSLQPKRQTQSHTYTGTIRPTITTWGKSLHSENYRATVDSFVITVPYQVEIDVSYEMCEAAVDPDTGDPLPDQERVCTPGTDSDAISGTFTVTVLGDEALFEVYEPNARGWLAHTAEWAEYHARDRYPASQPNDFYAGERILTRVQLDARHRHPYSGQYPQILSATAWISERGRASDMLASTLALQQQSNTLWGGPQHSVEKLGLREVGVDIPLMGDKQRGFAKDSTYAVHFTVQFAFGVRKGFVYPDKSVYTGHEQQDYRTVFRIIANAWERQGIRNHTTQ